MTSSEDTGEPDHTKHHNMQVSKLTNPSPDGWQINQVFQEAYQTQQIQNLLNLHREQIQKDVFENYALFNSETGMLSIPYHQVDTILSKTNLIPQLKHHDFHIGLQLCLPQASNSVTTQQDQPVDFESFIKTFAFVSYYYLPSANSGLGSAAHDLCCEELTVEIAIQRLTVSIPNAADMLFSLPYSATDSQGIISTPTITLTPSSSIPFHTPQTHLPNRNPLKTSHTTNDDQMWFTPMEKQSAPRLISFSPDTDESVERKILNESIEAPSTASESPEKNEELISTPSPIHPSAEIDQTETPDSQKMNERENTNDMDASPFSEQSTPGGEDSLVTVDPMSQDSLPDPQTDVLTPSMIYTPSAVLHATSRLSQTPATEVETHATRLNLEDTLNEKENDDNPNAMDSLTTSSLQDVVALKYKDESEAYQGLLKLTNIPIDPIPNTSHLRQEVDTEHELPADNISFIAHVFNAEDDGRNNDESENNIECEPKVEIFGNYEKVEEYVEPKEEATTKNESKSEQFEICQEVSSSPAIQASSSQDVDCETIDETVTVQELSSSTIPRTNVNKETEEQSYEEIPLNESVLMNEDNSELIDEVANPESSSNPTEEISIETSSPEPTSGEMCSSTTDTKAETLGSNTEDRKTNYDSDDFLDDGDHTMQTDTNLSNSPSDDHSLTSPADEFQSPILTTPPVSRSESSFLPTSSNSMRRASMRLNFSDSDSEEETFTTKATCNETSNTTWQAMEPSMLEGSNEAGENIVDGSVTASQTNDSFDPLVSSMPLVSNTPLVTTADEIIIPNGLAFPELGGLEAQTTVDVNSNLSEPIAPVSVIEVDGIIEQDTDMRNKVTGTIYVPNSEGALSTLLSPTPVIASPWGNSVTGEVNDNNSRLTDLARHSDVSVRLPAPTFPFWDYSQSRNSTSNVNSESTNIKSPCMGMNTGEESSFIAGANVISQSIAAAEAALASCAAPEKRNRLYESKSCENILASPTPARSENNVMETDRVEALERRRPAITPSGLRFVRKRNFSTTERRRSTSDSNTSKTSPSESISTGSYSSKTTEDALEAKKEEEKKQLKQQLEHAIVEEQKYREIVIGFTQFADRMMEVTREREKRDSSSVTSLVIGVGIGLSASICLIVVGLIWLWYTAVHSGVVRV